MFDKFQKMGQQVSNLKKIRDQAVQMQKQLQAEVIEVEENGIRVVMTGDQKVETVTIDGKYQEISASSCQKTPGDVWWTQRLAGWEYGAIIIVEACQIKICVLRYYFG